MWDVTAGNPRSPTDWPAPRPQAAPSPSCSMAWRPQSYVWVNGLFAGYGEDGFTPNEFDVTDLLHDGENVGGGLLRVFKCLRLEDQDFWRLHGLFRSVELAAQPHVHIDNMQIETDYDAKTGTPPDAVLSVRNAADAATISATLKDADGDVVWQTAHCVDGRTRFLPAPCRTLHSERRESGSLRA